MKPQKSYRSFRHTILGHIVYGVAFFPSQISRHRTFHSLPSSVSIRHLPSGDHHSIVRVHPSTLLLVFVPSTSRLKQIGCLIRRHAQLVNVVNESEKNVLQESGPEIEGEPRSGEGPLKENQQGSEVRHHSLPVEEPLQHQP